MNRDWVEKDYYSVLGVGQDAGAEQIKRAYRKLAQQYHPDANPDDPTSEEKFKDVSEAYSTLSNSEQKSQYDEVRRMVSSGGFQGFGSGPFAGGQGVRIEDLGDLLGGFSFGDLFGGGGARMGPQQGADVRAQLRLSFEEAVRGTTVTLEVPGDATCSHCKGSGAEPGTQVDVCPTCSGSGTVAQNQGFFSFTQPCRTCEGTGRVIIQRCSKCRGRGTERRIRRVTVRVPAGVNDGSTIRIRGKGAPGARGGPAGDLLVGVRVAEHPNFGRSGKDLTLHVPVTFTEAALGAEVAVPTLNGTVKLKVPAGTRSGRTFRVRGKGVKPDKGRGGDLLVTIDVSVPQKLSRPARKMLEEFREQYEIDNPRAHLGV